MMKRKFTLLLFLIIILIPLFAYAADAVGCCVTRSDCFQVETPNYETQCSDPFGFILRDESSATTACSDISMCEYQWCCIKEAGATTAKNKVVTRTQCQSEFENAGIPIGDNMYPYGEGKWEFPAPPESPDNIDLTCAFATPVCGSTGSQEATCGKAISSSLDSCMCGTQVVTDTTGTPFCCAAANEAFQNRDQCLSVCDQTGLVTITGQVTDFDNTALVNIEVIIFSLSKSVTTDDDGRYAISVPTDNNYVVTARFGGVENSTSVTVSGTSGSTADIKLNVEGIAPIAEDCTDNVDTDGDQFGWQSANADTCDDQR